MKNIKILALFLLISTSLFSQTKAQPIGKLILKNFRVPDSLRHDCNWNYVAGVGNDPRENRYFNILTQAIRYDSQGEYVKHWLPELASVPADKVHLISVLPPVEQQKYNVHIGVNFPKALFDVNRWRKK